MARPRRSPVPAAGAPRAAWPLLFAAFFGAALWVYGPALRGPFVSDDFHYVAQNPHVQGLSRTNLVAILDPTGPVAIDVVNYAPLQMLVHAAAWRAFGEDTLGHHLVNLTLHVLASVLLAALFASVGAPLPAAAVAGAIFLLHPANVEAVAWISQLKTTLSMVLVLAALLAWRRRPALATLAYALALLAKPTAAVALPAAALLDWVRGGPVRWRWVAGWFALLAGFALVEFTTHQRTGAADAALHAEPLVLLRTVAAIGARYVAMAATSWGTSAFHDPEPARSLMDAWWLAALPLLAAIGWRVAVVARRREAELVAWVWAAVSFAPVSQIFPFVHPMGDRYLYFILPGLLGAALGLGAEGLRLALPERRVLAGRVMLLLASALLLGFGVHAHARARLWRSNALLLADAAAHYPEGQVASLLAAKRAAAAGDTASAVTALRRARERGYNRFEQLEGDPAWAPLRDDPHFRALVREMAASWIASAERKPDPTQAELLSLAYAHVARDELPQALDALERAIALGGPRTPEVQAAAAAVRAGIDSGGSGRVRIGVSEVR